MPAVAVTSVNSIGPDGRAGVAVGVGVGDWLETSACCWATGAFCACLQAPTSSEMNKRTSEIEIWRIKNKVLLVLFSLKKLCRNLGSNQQSRAWRARNPQRKSSCWAVL